MARSGNLYPDGKDRFRELVSERPVPRIDFIDITRIYGVALVYYGHFIESYMKAGSAVAGLHYKFIYSFHMPLFFILSGYIAKEYVSGTNGVGNYLQKHAASRLVPYIFFSTILILPTFWTTDNTVGLSLPGVEGYVKGIASTFLAGMPLFNIPVWFLVCLFVVEIMHYFTSRFLTSNARVLLVAAGFYLAGSILSWNAGFLKPTGIFSPHGKIFPYFMTLEAFTGYSFYLVGFYLRRRGFLAAGIRGYECVLWASVCLVLVYLTFDLNKGMFTIPFYDAVVMVGSSHGNPILFPFTAIAGSMMVMLLAKGTGNCRALLFLGANTVTIFGLNGIFYHFINDRLAARLLAQYSGEASVVLAHGIVVALASMTLVLPCVFLMAAFAPQLIGRPAKDGPFISRVLS